MSKKKTVSKSPSSQRARRLSSAERATLASGEQALDTLTRAQGDSITGVSSRQARFNAPSSINSRLFYDSIRKWLSTAELQAPPYASDSRRRDAWLANFWRQEPHLAGVLSSVVALDTNRGWTMTGGRNQVNLYRDALLHGAENGDGWRTYAALQSQSFYTTDINAITEIGRAGIDGPLRAIWHVDPTLCQLTGDMDYPLEYTPPTGRTQKWTPNAFWRVASMPNIGETFNGLGFCAVSRALEFATLMVAVFQHDQEQLLARAPRGILLLHNIDEQQWFDALSARQAYADGLGRQWFGSVITLASSGTEKEAMSLQLQALSNLPANFDKKVFTSLVMYGYALCFGYDPSEFWPVEFGALGRGTETAVQHRKGTGKGGMSYVLAHQERIQDQLPAQLAFQYEQRDAEGELLDANLSITRAELVTMLYESGLAQNAPLLGRTPELARQRALSLLAEQGIIPRDWSIMDEDSEANDQGTDEFDAMRQRVYELPQVQRAIAEFPNEPIVRYMWPSGRQTVLWESGKVARKWGGGGVRRRGTEFGLQVNVDAFMRDDSKPVVHVPLTRAADTALTLPPVARLNFDLPTILTRASTIATVINDFNATILGALTAYMTRQTSIRSSKSAFLRAINSTWPVVAELGWSDGGADLDTFGDDGESELVAAATSVQLEYAELFYAELPDIREDEGDPLQRGTYYTRSLQGWYNEWLLRAVPNRMLAWELGRTKEHCETCGALRGVAHTARYWIRHNRIPGLPGADLACGGFRCRCGLRDKKTGKMVTLRLIEA